MAEDFTLEPCSGAERTQAMETGRKWWPDHLMDETVPDGKVHPTDWISGTPGAWRVGVLTDEGWRHEGESVAIGDTLTFHWLDIAGHSDVMVRGDGSFDVLGDEPRDYTNLWEPGDTDTLSDTLDTFAATIAMGMGHEDERVALAQFMRWGEARFTLVLDGETPRFVPDAASVAGDAR